MGPRKAATAFIFLIAVGSLLSALSAQMNNFTLMIVGKFVIGIGAAVVYIPIMKVLAVWYRKNEFASMSGVLLLVGNVGGIAAATPMVMMIDSMGLEPLYGASLISAVAVLLDLSATILEEERPSIEEIVSRRTVKRLGVHLHEDQDNRGP